MESTRFDDDPVQIYLREVAAIPPLTETQEIALCRHVLANDEQAEAAGKSLIEANLGMVISIVQRYPRGDMHFLDQVIRGNEGLLAALATFGEHPEEKFSVYAAACVEAAIGS